MRHNIACIFVLYGNRWPDNPYNKDTANRKYPSKPQLAIKLVVYIIIIEHLAPNWLLMRLLW